LGLFTGNERISADAVPVNATPRHPAGGTPCLEQPASAGVDPASPTAKGSRPMPSHSDSPDTAQPANEKLRRTEPDVIDQRQQQIDPAGENRRDVNAPASDSMKQPADRDASVQPAAPASRVPSYPVPPFPEQTQTLPGSFAQMEPRPDHGETSWIGAGRLERQVALITGGDSGIGRAVAIAYAREGANVAISYLDETEDAKDTERVILECGQQCLLLPGDISDPAHCRAMVAAVVEEFGHIDILVNNAAHQQTFDDIDDITDAEWQRTFAINIHAMFYLSKAAVPHMREGGSIINTASINSDQPNQSLLAYATTKGAVQNFTAGLAQMLADKAIRVNCVAPGPVWTPLIPGSFSGDKVAEFGANYPMKRPAQPVECASAYVMLAEPMSSYVSGATIAVTGGKPMI
jgi:NAD(P)-dependent dehydrogenase (short-subunit alcohol dehydrogenase family)